MSNLSNIWRPSGKWQRESAIKKCC